MSIKFKVRQGGASASQPDLANLAEAREGVPVFASDGTPLIDMAQRWEMGQAGQGSYTYVDVDGSLSYFHRPHAEVKLIEDESGTDYIIGWGRMEGGNDVARPTASGSGGPGHGTVEHNSIQVMDCNIDLRGLPFRTEWERPAETTWQRLQALELRSLNGSSSTGQTRRATTDITINNFTGGNHLVDASDPVGMEAHTYPVGTTPLDVMEDIFSQWEGKRWGVTIHHTDSGSHKCLLVLDPDDNETFQSALKISDHLEDWNPDDPDEPVLAPEWRRGAGKISDNSDVISGLISIYGGTTDDPRHVYVETADSEDDWETWVDVYNDDIARNETQAERRANKILADRKRPYVTPQPSIRLNPDQVTLITAGQSIEVKSVVINQGADRANYQWWRIAEIRWEPLPDGRWLAHLELGRAKNARGANGGGGPTQPGSTSPKPPPDCIPSDPGGIGDPVAGDFVFCPAPTGVTESNCGAVTGSEGCWKGQSPSSTPWDDITPGTYYSEIQLTTKYGGGSHVYTFQVSMRDLASVLPQVTTTLDSGTLVSCRDGGDWTTFSGTFDVPAGYDQIRFTLGSGTLFILEDSHLVNEFVPPGDPVENDPDCIPAGSGGDSPFYVRTDDPRLDADDQHLITMLRERVVNNSGGDLEAGDVVISDITFDGQGVTTTTTAANTNARVGVILEGGADEEVVVVLWEGATTVPVNIGADTAADGDYLTTSTTAGAAATEATRVTGSVGRVIRDASGDTQYVLWWGVPDASGSASGSDHGDLTGLADNDHPQYRLTTGNVGSVINVVAAAGSTETLSANYAVHDVTLTADCTISLTGAVAGTETTISVLLRQGSGAPWDVTWPAEVEWVGGSPPTLETAEDAWNWVELTTLNGGTTWFGDGGAAGTVDADDISALGFVGPILISDTPSTPLVFADLIQNEAQDDLVYADVG